MLFYIGLLIAREVILFGLTEVLGVDTQTIWMTMITSNIVFATVIIMLLDILKYAKNPDNPLPFVRLIMFISSPFPDIPFTFKFIILLVAGSAVFVNFIVIAEWMGFSI
jgi:hypothetical protein